MNQTLKRAGALVLAGAMCLGLFGCGDKKETESKYKTLAQELGYGYLSEYTAMDDLKLDYINSTSTAQGKLYLCGDYYDEEKVENYTRFYERDLASGTVKEIPLPELVNNDTTNEYIQQLSVCADGSGYWIITNQYTFSMPGMGEVGVMPAEGSSSGAIETAGGGPEYRTQFLTNEEPIAEMPAEEPAAEEPVAEEPAAEEPVAEEPAAEEPAADEDMPAIGNTAVEEPAEDSEAADDEAAVLPELPGEYVEPEEKYYAKKCDMSGNVLLEIDLSEITSEMDYFYCQSAAQDGEGNLYLSCDQQILCFGPDGSRKENVSTDEIYFQSMVATGNGTVLVSGWNVEGGGISVCRLENGGLTKLEVADLNQNGSCSLYVGEGDTVLMSDGTLLYSLDATTGQTTKLLSWLDSDINGTSICGLAAGGEDTVLVLLQDYHRNSGMSYELGTLTKTPFDQLPERTILALGAEYLDDTVRNAVIDFNRKNETYRVTLVDYSTYNTEEDYRAGAKQLERDIISGSCPDILSLNSGNAEKYISKGALADISALMEKDGEISMSDLMSGPLKAYQKDDKLYGMPVSFGLNTLYASAKLVGDRETWTMEDLSQIIDGLDEDTRIINWYTQTDFLTTMTYQNMNQFVDYSNATCSFDSDAFKKLLEVSAKLPETYENGTSDEGYAMAVDGGDEMQQLQAGDLLMATSYGVYDSNSVKNMYRLYTRENGIVRIGYPTETGNGAMLGVQGGLAIAAKSAHPEGAWAFIKTLLADEIQADMWNLPVTNAAFDKMLAEAMEKEYYMDENGEKVYTESMGWIGETEYEIGELTQEEADAFRDYVNGAAIAGEYDNDIMEIISEEAAAYFAGDKSVDEVAGLIQNRVKIYLGETS